jgi:acetyl esterase/lipase
LVIGHWSFRALRGLLFACLPGLLAAADTEPRAWRVLAAGDSITEGGSTFSNWRYHLWEKLTAAGYYIDYVGSREAPSRIGNLRHEGYGGKNVEFLAERLAEKFPSPAPDFLLLHTGHNHFAEEKPIPGMLAALERIVASARAANPRITILLAQVIPSLKLPKYAYLPEFNAALPAFAARLSTAASPIVIVDHATGFDPAVDTVADQVHPSASGAAKMAVRWFEALVKLLPPPAEPAPLPRLVPYKSIGGRTLELHVFSPSPAVGAPRLAGTAEPAAAPRPAIISFFGGGWSRGTPVQYYRECRHFAARGYVAIAADYRVTATYSKSTPFDSVADARSALRYVRAHAAELGIDPARIVAAGASAGGHLAAATALLPGLDDPTDDLSVSPRPAALVLWYPVIDNGPGGYGHERIGARYTEFSPLHNISATPPPPPTLVFLGTVDKLIPVATGQDFQKRLQTAGARCDLQLFPDRGHPIYDYRNPAAEHLTLRAECLAAADAFLRYLNFP